MVTIMTTSAIINKLKNIEQKQQYAEFHFGLAGSYANGTQTEGSDIDIVVNTGNLSPDEMEDIKSYFPGVDVDVLQLELLRQEDEMLDEFARQMGIPVNEDSVYKTVKREVMWV